MYEFLNSRKIELTQVDFKNFEEEREKIVLDGIEKVFNIFGDTQPSYLHYYWILSRWFDNNHIYVDEGNEIDTKLYEYGLLEKDSSKSRDFPFYKLTESGKQFLLKVRQDPKLNDHDLEKYILEA